jgi:tight adherence protein B
MVTVRYVLAVACCWLFLLAPGATAAEPGAQISALEVSANRVQFLLTLHDLEPGATVREDTVRVSLDGRPLTVRAEPPGAARPGQPQQTRAVMLVLDTSGSMSAADLNAARTGALSFIEQLPVDVPVGFTTTGTPSRPAVAPTTDRRSLAKALRGLRAGGETALYDGISTAVEQLRLSDASAGRLVVLSDGRDSASRATLAQTLARLSATGTPADVVAFKTAATSETTLRRLAETSGGRLLSSPDARRMTAAFTTAAATFRQAMWVTAVLPDSTTAARARLDVTVRAGTATIKTAAYPTLSGRTAAASAVPRRRVTAPAPAAPIALPMVLALSFAAVFALALMLGSLRGRPDGPDWAARIERYRVGGFSRTADRETAANPLLRGALELSRRFTGSGDLAQRMAGDLERAGIALRPHEWTLIRLAIGVVVVGLLSLLPGSPLLSILLGAALTWLATRTYVRAKAARRLRAFADQLPDALHLVAGSLRSGFSIAQSLERLAQQQVQPLGAEMARAVAQTRLGVSHEEALESVAERMRCRDLHWVVLAIQIQREVGGNLAQVIETTVETMRERTRLRRHVRALSAEGRFSAYIIIAMPFVAIAALTLMRPEYLRPLFGTPAGMAMLVLAGVMITVGWLWIRQVIKVEA